LFYFWAVIWLRTPSWIQFLGTRFAEGKKQMGAAEEIEEAGEKSAEEVEKTG
jgi:hypothetical protein